MSIPSQAPYQPTSRGLKKQPHSFRTTALGLLAITPLAPFPILNPPYLLEL